MKNCYQVKLVRWTSAPLTKRKQDIDQKYDGDGIGWYPVETEVNKSYVFSYGVSEDEFNKKGEKWFIKKEGLVKKGKDLYFCEKDENDTT